MTFQDLIITPFYLIIFTFLAYVIRPYVTTPATRKYFIPALWVRFAGAIFLGAIYQFYYDGGDTFNYFTHGSKWIYEAFQDNWFSGIALLFENGGMRVGETFEYSQHIWYYRDPHSFIIVRIAAFFDLFTFHTYSSTALFFALFSFSGLWALYTVLVVKYPNSGKLFAIAVLFIPSTVFWGSGILKDTITIGAMGWLIFACINIIDLKKRSLPYTIIAMVSAYLIFSIKVYILICLIPTLFVWFYWKNIIRIRNPITKLMAAPILLVIFGLMGFYALQQVSGQTEKYSLDMIAQRAAITAYDIRYGWGARTGGEGGYDLGVLDGTWQSMIRLFPAAVNVSLFRPYLWEVRNPLMLLSAMESFAVLILTLLMMFRVKRNKILSDPFMVFCLFFSLLFAFAVGISTFNFGTLMRYKIVMMPFYASALLYFTSRNT